MGWSASARMLPRASLTVFVVLSAACGSDDPKGDSFVEVDSGGGMVVEGNTAPPAKLDAGVVVNMDAAGPSSPTPRDAGPGVTTTPIGNPGAGPTTTDQGPGGGVSADGAVPVVVTPLPSDGNRRSVCYNDKPCAKDLFCNAPTGGTVQYPGLCTDGCRTDANCPAIDGIAQTCSADGQCIVNCAGMMNKGDAPCPVHEICRDISPNVFSQTWRCTYPDSSGSRDAPIYGPCSIQHAGGDCAGGATCHVPAAGLTLPNVPRVGGTTGYCTGECAMAMDCPVPDGTTAKPVCAGNRCEFDCAAAGANTCPDKMNCRDLSNNPLAPMYRCVFLE